MSKKTGNLRWSKFWWQDWLSDAALRFCSPAARGVWMDLLCISHEGTPYGHVTVNGKVPTNRQLASMIGVSVDELEPLLSELENAGVFSRRGALADDEKIVPVIRWLEAEGHFKPCADGVIFCRRMVRDIAAHSKGREEGVEGGNPEIRRGTVPKEDRVRPFRRTDSPAKTKRIFKKSGGCCHWCGVKLQSDHAGPDFFQVDHVVAVCDGGTNHESNLVAACTDCNQKRARVQPPTSTDSNSDSNPQEAKRLLEEEKKEPLLRNGADAPDATPTQTSFLPPVPKPEPTPLDILYAAGLPILVKLTGKSADDIRPHLGGLAKIAGPEIVLATLQDCENAPPKGSIYAWIRRCCEAEAKRRGVRLVVDNDPNDHWGIEAWCRSLPGVLPTETDEHRKVGKWLYSGAIVDGLARRIAEITQLPPTWRGDWTLLGEWLAAGHEIDAILEIVAEIAGRVDSIVSLRFFDDRVRRLPRPNLKYLERLQRKSA